MTQLLLIRHCEATGQEPEAPLSPAGRLQSEQLATLLSSEPVDHVVSSPYVRARETISSFASGLGHDVQLDERLIEHRLAVPAVPNWKDFVARAFVEPEVRAPGGESASETLERAWAAIRDAKSRGQRLPVVVTHGLLMSLVLHSIDGCFGYEGWASLQNPDAFRVFGPPGKQRFERLPTAS